MSYLNAGFCVLCRAVLDATEIEVHIPHHESLEALSKSSKSCQLCALALYGYSTPLPGRRMREAAAIDGASVSGGFTFKKIWWLKPGILQLHFMWDDLPSEDESETEEYYKFANFPTLPFDSMFKPLSLPTIVFSVLNQCWASQFASIVIDSYTNWNRIPRIPLPFQL